eukprot:2849359-Rhodomonas_salina.4
MDLKSCVCHSRCVEEHGPVYEVLVFQLLFVLHSCHERCPREVMDHHRVQYGCVFVHHPYNCAAYLLR